MKHLYRSLLATSLAVAGAPPPAISTAQSYHPLGAGWLWNYVSAADGQQMMTIAGERIVFGVPTKVRHQQEETQIYENFWTEDASGNLFVHGAVNYTFGAGWYFSPPLQMVASPLFAGRSWTTHAVRGYDLDRTPWTGDPFEYPMCVFTECVLEVPGGLFYSYGVGLDTGGPSLRMLNGRAFDLLGRCVDASEAAKGSATNWYAENVGMVKMNPFASETRAFLLVASGPPVGVVPETWGRVKAAFR